MSAPRGSSDIFPSLESHSEGTTGSHVWMGLMEHLAERLEKKYSYSRAGSVISINELKLASPSDSHTTSTGDSSILLDSESTDADSTSGNYEPSPKRPVDRILMKEHHKSPEFDCCRSIVSPDCHSEAKLSNRPSSMTSSLEIGLTKLAAERVSLQKQTASFSFHRQPKSSTQSAHSVHSTTVVTCWYHTTFGAKARRSIFVCSFIFEQRKRAKRISPKGSAANLLDSPNPGCTFRVGDIRNGRRFLVDTGAQLSVIPPTSADRRCPNLDHFLQAANTSLITTFGTCSLSLDIGRRRLFFWVFVVADSPRVILGADFFAASDILIDWPQSRLHDKTTNLTTSGISSSDASRRP
nr:unnamed protein product [Spirometra erinaceieuropaei]